MVHRGRILKTFDMVVSALVYSILRERCPHLMSGDHFPNNAIRRFVVERHRRMSDMLRYGLWVGTIALEVLPVFVAGRRLSRLSHARRWRFLMELKRRQFPVMKDVLVFYEMLTVFGVHAECSRFDVPI